MKAVLADDRHGSPDSIVVKVEGNPYESKQAKVFHESFGNTDSLKIVHEKPPSDTYNPKPNSAMYKKKHRTENQSKVSFPIFTAELSDTPQRA
jgi:hypothetical protein